ncbi:MAG: UvrD-helicase domain-containing protein [Synergistaceae bacterium]|nr:UvrD-helicase domain-containing protein [Synergistaceae bacterium]
MAEDGGIRNSLMRLLSGEREEQRQAITSRDKLTVVSAGAGTGKTHTLARRFAWLLASDPDCRVQEILTLTFTHLAANEMRERIKGTLIAWRNSDPVGLGHLDDAIGRIDEAYISTIHAFALRVIRESGLDLDIDPGSSLIGNASQTVFWEDYKWNLRTAEPERMSRGMSDEWRTFIKDHMSSPSYVAFLNYFGAEALAALAKESGDVFGSLNEIPKDMLGLAAVREDAARRRVIKLLSGDWRLASDTWWFEVFPAIDGELEDGGKGVFSENLRELRSRWSKPPFGQEAEARFTADIIRAGLSKIPGKSNLKDRIEDALGCKLTDWKKRFSGAAGISESLFGEPPYPDSEALVRKMLLSSAAMGWESWDAARRRAGGLTFSDLVRCATRVLETGTYADRFKHVLVDEFQDTDGLQNDMIKALSTETNNSSVFLVGDIKQSIYRFRHAEPRLFGSYMERTDARNIPLACSYRMSGAMMDAVNAVFGDIWRDGVISPGEGAAALRYEPLLAPVDAPWWGYRNSKNNAPPMEILLYTGQTYLTREQENDGEGTAPFLRKLTAGEKRKRLAVGLVKRLCRMTAGGEEIWDKEMMDFRPVRWGDVAILVPSRTFYGVLEEALQEAGINAIFESGMEYFKRGEVRDMINTLRALSDPRDNYALACWAESPFSGLRPGTSLDLAPDAENAYSLWNSISRDFPDDARRFMKLRRRARLAGPSSALLSLITDTSWLAAYEPAQHPHILAYLLRGVEITRDYEVSFGRNLSACADYLDRAMRGGFQADEPQTPEDGDCVRVKTVHASKGQEFPVVALMGMESAVRPKSTGRVSVSRHLGVVSKTLPLMDGDSPGSTSESVTAEWHRIIEDSEEREEKERLLYVAMTRAQEKLICCGVRDEQGERGENTPGKSISWLDWLLSANEKNGAPFPVSFAEDSDPERVRAKRQPERERPSLLHFRASADFPAVSLSSLSATAYALFMWCPAAYRIKYRQGRELKWELPDGDGYGGADLGSLAHWVLSRWDLTPEGLNRHLPPCDIPVKSEERMRRTIPAFLRPVFASKQGRETLRSWLLAFASSDECLALRGLEKDGALRRELSFRIPFAGANLVGSIDLYWEDNSGIHVRDWKITQAERAPDELYREQVNFYSLVCRIASGSGSAEPAAPIDAGLIYLRPGNEGGCEIWNSGEHDSTAQNVEDIIKTAAAGPFPPARERCGRCPFRASCLL